MPHFAYQTSETKQFLQTKFYFLYRNTNEFFSPFFDQLLHAKTEQHKHEILSSSVWIFTQYNIDNITKLLQKVFHF